VPDGSRAEPCVQDVAVRDGRIVAVGCDLAVDERGRQLIGQVDCCPLSIDFTFASPQSVEGLGAWKHGAGRAGRRAAGHRGGRRCAADLDAREPRARGGNGF
jgi:hypothetical protein